MQTFDSKIFTDAYFFTLSSRKMGNSRKGDINQVAVDAKKSRLRLSKQLLESSEYDAILEYQREVYAWCMARCNPSFFKKGIYVVKRSLAEAFNQALQEANARIKTELVPAFQRAYPTQVDQARIDLNGQFREKDYPEAAQLPALFGIDWNWITLGVPDDLPAELRAAEEAKLKKKFQDAEQEILRALREGFKALIDHAVDKLKTPPGEQPKQFKSSLISNIRGFISTFSAKNLLNDRQLENLVKQAEQVLTGVTPDSVDADKKLISESALRTRQELAAKFDPIKTVLDGMITQAPSRQFNFDEE